MQFEQSYSHVQRLKAMVCQKIFWSFHSRQLIFPLMSSNYCQNYWSRRSERLLTSNMIHDENDSRNFFFLFISLLISAELSAVHFLMDVGDFWGFVDECTMYQIHNSILQQKNILYPSLD